MMSSVAEELGVPYKNCGSLVVAFGGEEEKTVKSWRCAEQKTA
jgi:L-2-hydroxyglutarate oxidase LhgO